MAKLQTARLLLLALCLSGTALGTPAAVLSARQSAVQILWAKKGKQHAICSGAVISLPEGPRVVTAGHCALEPELIGGTFAALDAQGHIWPLRLERAAFQWPQRDYAVFNSAAEYLLPALKVSSRAYVIGSDCYSWSGPAGLNIMLFHGEVTGQLHTPTDPVGEAADGGMWYSASLLITGGASGSSVLDENGDVLGLLVGGFDLKTKLGGAFFAPLPPPRSD